MKIPFSVYDFFAYLATGFIVLSAADYAFGLGWLQKEKLPPGMIVFLTLGAYVLGHLVANLSSYFLEHRFLRGVLKSPEETLFNETKGGWALLFPIFFKPFPAETQKRVLDRAVAAGIIRPGRGLFFHCHSIVKRDKSTADRLGNFLNTYGFCRNASMASLIAAAILLCAAVRHMEWKTAEGLETDKLVWAAVAIIVAIGLFYRYLKFFKHYTEEVFRDYAEPVQGVDVSKHTKQTS